MRVFSLIIRWVFLGCVGSHGPHETPVRPLPQCDLLPLCTLRTRIAHLPKGPPFPLALRSSSRPFFQGPVLSRPSVASQQYPDRAPYPRVRGLGCDCPTASSESSQEAVQMGVTPLPWPISERWCSFPRHKGGMQELRPRVPRSALSAPPSPPPPTLVSQ